MKLENHERAKRLLRADRVEGIAAGERRWLDAHLDGCRECSEEANALANAIGSIKALGVAAPAGLARRTSLAVRQHAQQRRAKGEPAVFLGIAAVFSSVWAIVTTPYLWTVFAWSGSVLHMPQTVWQLAFLMWWFLPATVLAAVACGRRANRAAGMDWKKS